MVLKMIQKMMTSSQTSTHKNEATEKASPALTADTPAKKGAAFSTLGLIKPLLDAVSADGYTHATPIQEQSIPQILLGRDILGCAQTGTGKTAAFALPILQRLTEKKANQHTLRALVLAPTRELALQIQTSFVSYGKHLPLKSAVVFGGVGIEPQIKAVKGGADIIVATPGRLLDLMQRRVIDYRHLEVLVLDEADRMLDMGFINDIKRILKQLPTKRQNLLFSATIPKEVQGLIDSILVKPVRVEVTPVSSTSQQVVQRLYYVARNDKRKLLLHIMDNEAVTKGLVFTRTKHNANKLEAFLKDNGVIASAIHGNKSQSARQKALEGFRSGKVQILVASDIAARGIDIDDISHVINFEMPNEPETYVHRIGRTGRAQARGVAISFCDNEERKHVTQIERTTKVKIPVEADHPFIPGSPHRTDAGSSSPRPVQKSASPSGDQERSSSSERDSTSNRRHPRRRRRPDRERERSPNNGPRSTQAPRYPGSENS